TGTVPASGRTPEVGFLFSGHGGQYADMGRQLFETAPVFRAAIEECDDLLSTLIDRPLLDILFTSAAAGGRSEDLPPRLPRAQPALSAGGYALASLWESWGVRPAAVAGHSLGEYVAAVVAGVMSLADGLRLVGARGELMASLPPDGAMATAFASEARVAEAIE